MQSLPEAFHRYLVPVKGRVFIKADFSACQLRLLAHLSQDEALIEMFQTGSDPHDETRERLESKGIQITGAPAKAVNFAICCGGTAWSIRSALGRDLSAARRIMRELSPVYPSVASYLDSLAGALDESLIANRQVKSFSGRRRCFYHEGSLTDREKSQAINGGFETSLHIINPVN
jgi:DNA polymerase I